MLPDGANQLGNDLFYPSERAGGVGAQLGEGHEPGLSVDTQHMVMSPDLHQFFDAHGVGAMTGMGDYSLNQHQQQHQQGRIEANAGGSNLQVNVAAHGGLGELPPLTVDQHHLNLQDSLMGNGEPLAGYTTVPNLITQLNSTIGSLQLPSGQQMQHGHSPPSMDQQQMGFGSQMHNMMSYGAVQMHQQGMGMNGMPMSSGANIANPIQSVFPGSVTSILNEQNSYVTPIERQMKTNMGVDPSKKPIKGRERKRANQKVDPQLLQNYDATDNLEGVFYNRSGNCYQALVGSNKFVTFPIATSTDEIGETSDDEQLQRDKNDETRFRSGQTGVTWNATNMAWVAQWYDNKELRVKYYSTNKTLMGEDFEEALRKASRKRREMEEVLGIKPRRTRGKRKYPPEEALRLAIEARNSAVREGKIVPKSMKPARFRSGVTGVIWNNNYMAWQAHWKQDGKLRIVSFPTCKTTSGPKFEESLTNAIKKRREMEVQLGIKPRRGKDEVRLSDATNFTSRKKQGQMMGSNHSQGLTSMASVNGMSSSIGPFYQDTSQTNNPITNTSIGTVLPSAGAVGGDPMMGQAHGGQEGIFKVIHALFGSNNNPPGG